MGLDDIYNQINGLAPANKTAARIRVAVAPVTNIKAAHKEVDAPKLDVVDTLLAAEPKTNAKHEKTVAAEKAGGSDAAKKSLAHEESELHGRLKFATGANFNQRKFDTRLSRYITEKRLTHISKDQQKQFSKLVAGHARNITTGHQLDRAAQLKIKQDLHHAWKAGEMSHESVHTFKKILGDL